MLKNLAVIKFFLDRIMYIYIILLFTCSFILCFLVVHEVWGNVTFIVWLADNRDILNTYFVYIKQGFVVLSILYLLINDLLKIETAGLETPKTEMPTIFNPFSSEERLMWVNTLSRIARSSDSWWYKSLQLEFFIFFLAPSRLFFKNYISFHLPQTTALVVIFLFFNCGVVYDQVKSAVVITYTGIISISFIGCAIEHHILTRVIKKYKNLIYSLSLDKKTLDFFTGNFSGRRCLSPEVVRTSLLCLVAVCNSNEARQAVERQVFYEKHKVSLDSFNFNYTPEEFKKFQIETRKLGFSFFPSTISMFISFIVLS